MKVGYLKILEIADSVRPSPSERFSKVIYQLLLSFEWEFGDLFKHLTVIIRVFIDSNDSHI